MNLSEKRFPGSHQILPCRRIKPQVSRHERSPAAEAQDEAQRLALRNYGCELSLAVLSAVTQQPRYKLQAETRCKADIAFARQVAMYLAHTKFGIPYAEVGTYFKRDRTTVAHACQLVEDKRDDAGFDDHLSRMESLIDAAIPATPSIQQRLASFLRGGCS